MYNINLQETQSNAVETIHFLQGIEKSVCTIFWSGRRSSFLFAAERLAVCALALRRVGFMGTNRDGIQRAVVAGGAMVCALGHRTADRLVCLTLIHLKCLLLFGVLLSYPDCFGIIHKKNHIFFSYVEKNKEKIA